MATRNQLRKLFTTISSHCAVTSPKNCWNHAGKYVLSKDMEHRHRKVLNYPTLCLTASQSEARTHLGGNREDGETSGKTLKEYPVIELLDSLEIKN